MVDYLPLIPLDEDATSCGVPRPTPETITALARSTDDFAFEMRIGRDLRCHSAPAYDNNIEVRIRHAETYIDHRTGTERPFDYQCTFRNEWRFLHLAIECKNLALESPAVICGQGRKADESFHDMIFAAHGTLVVPANHVTYRNTGVSDVVRVTQSPLYPVADPANSFLGKSVFRPRPAKNKDEKSIDGFVVSKDREEYDAWNQSVGSAASMAKISADFFRSPSSPDYWFTVALPVMVVPDGALWRVRFDDNGLVVGSAEPVDEATYFRDHAVQISDSNVPPIRFTARFSHIHFVTASGLVRLVEQLSHGATSIWNQAFPEKDVAQLLKRFQF